MRLLLVELNRLRSRRAIALMLLAVVLLVGWMTVDTIWQSRAASTGEIAAAKERAAESQVFAAEDYQRCLDDPTGYFGDESAAADDCQLYEGSYQDFLARQPLSLDQELGDTGKAAVVVLAGLAIIGGATFAGADWATGSVSNQLLFRPRRLQVWSAKALALLLGVTIAAAAVIAAQWTSYVVTAEVRDLAHSPDFVNDLLSRSARGVGLVAAAALGGFAVTMALRSTVGTLALLLFYSIGGEALVELLPFERVSRFSLASNVFAWLDDGALVYDPSIPCPPTSDLCTQTYTLSLTHGATYLGVLLVIAVVASIVLFRRRDVP